MSDAIRKHGGWICHGCGTPVSGEPCIEYNGYRWHTRCLLTYIRHVEQTKQTP